MKSSQLNKALNLVKRTGDKMVIFDQESDAGYALLSLDQYEDLLNEAEFEPSYDDDDDDFDGDELSEPESTNRSNWFEDAKASWVRDDSAGSNPFDFGKESHNNTSEHDLGTENHGDEAIDLEDHFYAGESLNSSTEPKTPTKPYSSLSGFEHVGSIASRTVGSPILAEEEQLTNINKGDLGGLEEVTLSDVPSEDVEEETFLLEPVE